MRFDGCTVRARGGHALLQAPRRTERLTFVGGLWQARDVTVSKS